MTYIEPFAKERRGDAFGDLSPYRKGKPHRGQDWTVPEGSLIVAITDGEIWANGWSNVLGWYVTQKTSDGLYATYAHLKKQSGRSAGTKIKLGQSVGFVGSTGTASTGAHLHLSLGKANPITCSYNKLFDPIKHIEENL